MAKRKENSTNSLNRKYITTDSNLTYSICMVGGRWKLLILGKLEKRKLRFSELRNEICNITERMLTLQLRELVNDGIVKRTVYAEVPVRVEYELTDIGKELIPIWEMLCRWGAKHKSIFKKDNEAA